MKKLLLLLLFPFICNAQLGLDSIPTYTICQSSTNGGYALFFLNDHIQEILSPENYNWEFYLDQAAIDAGTSLSLSESGLYENIIPYQQTIYLVVTAIDSGISQTMPLNLVVANGPSSVTPSTYALCDESLPNDGITVFDLTAKDNEIKGICFDCIVSYHLNLEDAENDVAITNPENFSNTSNSQVLYARVTAPNIANCYQIITLTLKVLPLPIENALEPLVYMDINNVGQVVVDFYSMIPNILGNNNPQTHSVNFFLTIDDAWIGSNAIPSPEEYYAMNGEIVYYRLEYTPSESMYPSCYIIGSMEIIILPQDYETPPPIGVTEQTFSEGETLADIELEGEDIQWYDNPGEETDFIFTPKNGESPLPRTTVLVDGTTYYASQTIYGIESNNRLAVTVFLSLGITDNQFTGMTYYPNPTKDVLTIVNNNDIETVNIVNMLGQSILNKQINNTTAQMNLSSLQSGIYLVNITSGGKSKTLKIIKE